MNLKPSILTLSLALAASAFAASNVPVYLDETRPLEERVEDALSRMTLREKVAMCHAEGKFASPGVARLGIPDLWMSDGPHGVGAETIGTTGVTPVAPMTQSLLSPLSQHLQPHGILNCRSTMAMLLQKKLSIVKRM